MESEYCFTKKYSLLSKYIPEFQIAGSMIYFLQIVHFKKWSACVCKVLNSSYILLLCLLCLGIPPPRPGMMRPPLVPPLGPAPPGLFPPAPLPNLGVLSAASNLIQRPKADDTSAATIEKKATATISAKPQITNPKADITRFVPTTLQVRWENKGAAAAPQRKSEDDSAVPLAKTAPKSGPSVPVSVQTKDDVYEAFMKEMEGLL